MTKLLKKVSRWYLELTQPEPEYHTLELIRAMRQRQFALMLQEQRKEIQHLRQRHHQH